MFRFENEDGVAVVYWYVDPQDSRRNLTLAATNCKYLQARSVEVLVGYSQSSLPKLAGDGACTRSC